MCVFGMSYDDDDGGMPLVCLCSFEGDTACFVWSSGYQVPDAVLWCTKKCEENFVNELLPSNFDDVSKWHCKSEPTRPLVVVMSECEILHEACSAPRMCNLFLTWVNHPSTSCLSSVVHTDGLLCQVEKCTCVS